VINVIDEISLLLFTIRSEVQLLAISFASRSNKIFQEVILSHITIGVRNDSMEEQNVAEVGNHNSPDSPHIVPADRGFSTPLELGN